MTGSLFIRKTLSIYINQVHAENCSFSPHPQPLSQRATVYTHLGQGINALRDPPKSPLKKGDFESGSPFFKGGWGGSNPVEARSEDLCVHGSPKGEGSRKSFQSPSPWREGLKPSAYMKRVRENSGFQVRRGLSPDFVQDISRL